MVDNLTNFSNLTNIFNHNSSNKINKTINQKQSYSINNYNLIPSFSKFLKKSSSRKSKSSSKFEKYDDIYKLYNTIYCNTGQDYSKTNYLSSKYRSQSIEKNNNSKNISFIKISKLIESIGQTNLVESPTIEKNCSNNDLIPNFNLDFDEDSIYQDPEFLDPYFLLGLILYKLEMYNQSIECLNSSLDSQKENIKCFYIIGKCLLKLDNLYGRKYLSEKLSFSKPTYLYNLTDYIMLIKYYNKAYRHQEALLVINFALEKFPREYELYYYKGKINKILDKKTKSIKNFKKAIECLEESIKNNNQSCLDYINMAKCYKKLENYTKMRECIETSIKLDHSSDIYEYNICIHHKLFDPTYKY